ncbi:hypothetical protein [Pinibacter soli]|uniref:AAA+ ATPase domain-containing protein n=1 Tax=Pinibacter soli TaxID=3044211 RepID=A0ABT6R9B7_9BACT|nr:hypothetical protein [Pinibacter soli]MDI3319158.1 hypothetical protein [Pinibacter soli]
MKKETIEPSELEKPGNVTHEKIERGTSVTEVLETKIECLDFEGEWFDAFEKPQSTGVWFIWGNSGNGKTRFTYLLCKYLTKFGKVAYNSLEEGKVSRPMQKAFKQIGMSEVGGKLVTVCEDIQELTKRLERRKGPDIAVIDSVQYARLKKNEYLAFREKFKNTKLLIFISQTRGKLPAGSLANDIMFDANQKIWIEGFRAITKGRSIGPVGHYTIWNEGAAKYWGEPINN